MIGVYDSMPVPFSPLALPGKGKTFVDPDFGGELVQVTGKEDGVGASSTYAYYRSLSLHNDYIVLGVDKGHGFELMLYSFGSSEVPVQLRPLLEGSTINTEVHWDATFWDARLPTVCYVIEPEKQRIWSIDVSKTGAAQFDVVRRFNKPGELAGCSLKQHSCSDDGNVWAFHAIHPDGTITAHVWNRTTNLLRSYNGPATTPINECQITPDGATLRVFFKNSSCVLWNLQNDYTTISNLLNHADWAPRVGPGILFACGDKVFGENAITVRALGETLSPTSIWSPKRRDGSTNWDLANHVAMPPGKDFIVVSAYVKLPRGTPRPWEPYEGEIFLVFYDGRTPLRLCRHRSEGAGGTATTAGDVTIGDANGDPLGYWSQPRASVSRDGRYVVFTALINGRLDVFILKIPPSNEVQNLQEELAGSEAVIDETEAVLVSRTAERDAARVELNDARVQLDSMRQGVAFLEAKRVQANALTDQLKTILE